MLRRSHYLLLPLGLVLASTTGCGQPDGACEVVPEDLRMRAVIVDDGFSAFADISFSDLDDEDSDGSLRLCLDKGSSLLVNGLELEEDGSAGWRYLAEFAVPPAEYEIEYVSGVSGETFTATVQPVADFEFALPEPMAELSRAEDVQVEWNNFGPGQPDGEARLAVFNDDITCLERDYEAFVDDDAQSFVVPANAIEATEDPEARCDAAFLLVKAIEGDYPAGLHPDGYIDAVSLRERRFISVP